MRDPGPIRDVLRSARTREDVRPRSGSKSLKSVQRYTKSFMLMKERGQTPPAIRETRQASLAAPVSSLLKAVRASPASGSFLALCIQEALEPLNRKGAEAAASARAPTPDGLRHGGELSALTLEALRKLCAERGMRSGGRKAQLIERLSCPP